MEYYFKPTALRSLKKLPKTIQKRILNKLDFYIKSENPFDFAEVLQYKEFGGFRFRIGDYRVIFDFENKSSKIIILLIGHRKNIYK